MGFIRLERRETVYSPILGDAQSLKSNTNLSPNRSKLATKKLSSPTFSSRTVYKRVVKKNKNEKQSKDRLIQTERLRMEENQNNPIKQSRLVQTEKISEKEISISTSHKPQRSTAVNPADNVSQIVKKRAKAKSTQKKKTFKAH